MPGGFGAVWARGIAGSRVLPGLEKSKRAGTAGAREAREKGQEKVPPGDKWWGWGRVLHHFQKTARFAAIWVT